MSLPYGWIDMDYRDSLCRHCGVEIFFRDGRWRAVILGSCGDVCPDEAIGGVRPEHYPEIISVGWDGHSNPMLRYRADLSLSDHLRRIVREEDK